MQANPDAYVYDAYKCAFAPLPSPDGQKVIYQRSNTVGSIACSYYVYDVQSGESVLLFDRSYSGRYVASFNEEVILWLDNDTIRICPVVRPEGKIDILDLTVDFRFQNGEWQRFDLLRAEPAECMKSQTASTRFPPAARARLSGICTPVSGFF